MYTVCVYWVYCMMSACKVSTHALVCTDYYVVDNVCNDSVSLHSNSVIHGGNA